MMDYDMFVPGNHEFNYGMTILQRQLNYLTSDGTETESSVAVGCANYLDSTKQGGETTNWSTWNGYAPYQLYDYNGVTVAVMGIGNPNIPKWDVPANWEGIYFANVIETYKHYEQEMTEKADLIVLASHSGIDSDAQSDFIRRLVSETNSIWSSAVTSTAMASPRLPTATARKSPCSPCPPRQLWWARPL